MISEIESVLNFINSFLRSMHRMDSIHVGIEELQFLEFWGYYFKIFKEYFVKEEMVTTWLIKILKYVSKCTDFGILDAFITEQKDFFGIIITELISKNPLVMMPDTFTCLGDFTYGSLYASKFFYECKLFPLLLDLLAANSIDRNPPIYALYCFIKQGDQNLVHKFVESNPEMFALFFEIIRDPGLRSIDCLRLLEIIRMTTWITADCDGTLAMIRSNADYLDALDYAQSRHAKKIQTNQNLESFLNNVLQQNRTDFN
jgi:hypothetical protein